MARSVRGQASRFTRRTLLTGGLVAGGLGGLDGLRGSTGRTADAASSAPPRRGGMLFVAQDVDPISLDPHTNANISALQGYEHAYEGLTTYDEKLNVIPALATRWEISSDQKTYTFHLRPGVKFHNDQTLTAQDVKYSIERVLDPNWWYYVKINFEALSARIQGYAQSFTGRRMFLKRAWIA